MFRWSTNRELTHARDEMGGLFSGFTGAVHEFPALNVWNNENDATVTAELPGIDAEDLDITVVGDTMTLRGARKPLEMKENESMHRRERVQGAFTRNLTLPFRIDNRNVTARMQRGVLTITLPKAEEDKAKKIPIKAE